MKVLILIGALLMVGCVPENEVISLAAKNHRKQECITMCQGIGHEFEKVHQPLLGENKCLCKEKVEESK